ncbi:hypothetical protein GCM10009779_57700 [Polymorphospora rubra]|uniref:Uncharacterized protein n=1 Tax=Polymorphospora rubra TaxID=338584 RepID=A0A810N5K6_9ACTN|nr:hypothetical protein Prubr_40490 [Polymorphospora rubra]
MQVRAPTRPVAARIGTEAVTSPVLDRDDPQQFGGRRTTPATHAGAHRQRTTNHEKVYPYAPATAPPGSAA